jgi:membrane-bound ClpP family serine protease
MASIRLEIGLYCRGRVSKKERGQMSVNDTRRGISGAALLMVVSLTVNPGFPAQTQVPLLNSLLAALANPNVAYLLLIIGLLGVVAEIVTPGAVG